MSRPGAAVIAELVGRLAATLTRLLHARQLQPPVRSFDDGVKALSEALRRQEKP